MGFSWECGECGEWGGNVANQGWNAGNRDGNARNQGKNAGNNCLMVGMWGI